MYSSSSSKLCLSWCSVVTLLFPPFWFVMRSMLTGMVGYKWLCYIHHNIISMECAAFILLLCFIIYCFAQLLCSIIYCFAQLSYDYLFCHKCLMQLFTLQAEILSWSFPLAENIFHSWEERSSYCKITVNMRLLLWPCWCQRFSHRSLMLVGINSSKLKQQVDISRHSCKLKTWNVVSIGDMSKCLTNQRNA